MLRRKCDKSGNKIFNLTCRTPLKMTILLYKSTGKSPLVLGIYKMTPPIGDFLSSEQENNTVRRWILLEVTPDSVLPYSYAQ